MYGPLTNNDGHYFLFDSSWTMFTVDTIALTPEITVWQNSNPVMTGTGTGVGNTITIKDATGNAIATTTVGEDGKWSADLTGVDQSTGLYVEESNDLGDQTGVVAATQFETANRIIHYVDEQGNELHSVFTQDLPVQRENTATIDPTSQIVSWVPGTWEPAIPTINYFSTAGNPMITGYYTKDVVAPSAPFSDLDVNNITTPLNTDVLYQKLASWEPSEPGVAPIDYPNDPANPGGVLDPSSPEAPALPYVPGKTPVGPDGNPLAPKDPNDPSKGYIPPTPADPGTATPISYVADTQKGTVTYQDINDAANPAVLGLVDPLSGDSGSTSDYRAIDRIAELIAKGYALQDNPYPATGVVFDTDTSKNQDFIITFTHATATITPDKPGVPGDPIDPNNPDGPKWPAGSDDVSGLTKAVTETITYVNDQGDTVVADYTDTVNFATTATVDLSNGQITIASNWTVTSKNPDGTADTTFDEVNSPLIPGYFADKGAIAAVTGITPDTANINE